MIDMVDSYIAHVVSAWRPMLPPSKQASVKSKSEYMNSIQFWKQVIELGLLKGFFGKCIRSYKLMNRIPY